MKVMNFSDMTAERWNDFAIQWPDFELMQSYEWGKFKQAQGWRVVRLAVERDSQLIAGAQMLIKQLPLGIASIAYIPRGPLLHWEDETAAQMLLAALHASARRYRAISLKIEPPVHYSSEMLQHLQFYGFRRSAFNNQPQCSIVVDLTPDDDTILANMHKTTRYNVRYSARKGVVVREGTAEDLDTFYRLLESTARHADFTIRSYEYYRQEWNALAPRGAIKLFLAMYEDEVLAMRMPAVFGECAATLHSGSLGIHRKLKPNELLMWESFKWAKTQDCTTYDLWGIPEEVGANLYLDQPLPEQQEGGLWGVYNFKRGFGGDVIYYVGTYDFVYSRPLYWLINKIMARIGSLEKVMRLGGRLGFGTTHMVDK